MSSKAYSANERCAPGRRRRGPLETLDGPTQGVKWFNRLASARNFIAHIGAFYLALDTTEPAWDLLLVKGNIKQFDDPRTYVRFSSVMEIMDGFLGCREAMQAHLVALFEAAK